jgi:hypothetical protein
MRGLPVLLLLFFPNNGMTWGVEGHRLVARIAEGLLTDAANAKVQTALAPGESIDALASWADDVRRTRKETEPWHYIDIPILSNGLDMKRDCPAGDCIIAKIEEFRKVWGDPSVPRERRREALLFLVHFVGDLHQPLHCATANDKGGNDVKLSFDSQNTNLHSLWDSGLLRRMPEEEQLLMVLCRDLTAKRMKKWSRGTVEDWAEESFRAAQRAVYHNLSQTAEGAIEPGTSYEQQAETVIRRRLEQAGVRLAAILNEAAH